MLIIVNINRFRDQDSVFRMTSEQTIRRSDILNTQVITRDNGKRIGIVSQIWVDIEQREVVALSLKDSLISVSGIPRYMYLNSINQIGDVVLVDNEDVIEDIDPESYTNLMNWEVITETGDILGKVRGFKFDGISGKMMTIQFASIGLPQIPDRFLSTYELSIEEIVSTGPNRLIVFEGAEERVQQLTVGLLESLGIGKASWEKDDDIYSAPKAIRPENQLPSGIPLEAPRQKIRQPEPVVREEWDEDYYEEEIRQPAPPARKVMEARPYESESVRYEEDDDEDDNWSDSTEKDTYDKPKYEAPKYEPPKYEPPKSTPPVAKVYEEYDDDVESDAWEEAPKQPLNIPKKEKEKEKQPEYEE